MTEGCFQGGWRPAELLPVSRRAGLVGGAVWIGTFRKMELWLRRSIRDREADHGYHYRIVPELTQLALLSTAPSTLIIFIGAF